MTKDKFLVAMVDTLVPGGVLANGIVAPAASSIGITWDALEERHGRVLAAIATQAGGEEDFCLGTDEFRADVLRQVERSRAQDFAALLATVPLYYESPNVLAAFGWPSRPPQPWAMS